MEFLLVRILYQHFSELKNCQYMWQTVPPRPEGGVKVNLDFLALDCYFLANFSWQHGE